jgi:hypothetical protein
MSVRDIHLINSGTVITNGISAITPTDGNPSGQTYLYDGGRSLKSPEYETHISLNFGHTDVDISRTGPLVNGSGSIDAANTSQQIFANLNGRNYFYFENTSSATMYVNFGSNADTSNSYKISAGETLIFDSGFVPDSAVNVYCGTQSSTFVAKQA